MGIVLFNFGLQHVIVLRYVGFYIVTQTSLLSRVKGRFLNIPATYVKKMWGKCSNCFLLQNTVNVYLAKDLLECN
jgi:hypothetical protein